jgi:hypothetical protein
MNEIERLVSAIGRPEPSQRLNERIQALFAPDRDRRRVSRWRMAIAWCGTAACVGLLGFYLGRQSAIVQLPPEHVSTATPSSHPPDRASLIPASVVNIPLRDDQLAGLFMPREPREGMLGRGPFKIEVSTSP